MKTLSAVLRPATLGLLAAGALLALSGSSSAAQPDDQPGDAPLPGLWVYKYKAYVFSVKDETKCLNKSEVKRFFAGLCNKGSTCTYSVNEAHDGKVRMVGEWIDHKGRHTQVSGTGVYNPTSFNLKADIVVHYGITLPVKGTISGQRLSPDCPPGMENKKPK